MGQRTRMGRAKTGGVPISRREYLAAKGRQIVAHADAVAASITAGVSHPAYLDNAAGRARFAAKHAAEPRVRYERTEQSSYSGPKTPPHTLHTPAVVRSYRKVGEETRPDGTTRPIFRLIAAILGR